MRVCHSPNVLVAISILVHHSSTYYRISVDYDFLLSRDAGATFCFFVCAQFVASSFWTKMQYIDSLRTELVMDEFTMQQMRIPDFVIEYEKYWFGPTDAP